MGDAEGGTPFSCPSNTPEDPLGRPLPGGVWTPGLHAFVCLAWHFVTWHLSPGCAPQSHSCVSPLCPQHLCLIRNFTQEVGVMTVHHFQPP